MVERKSQQLEGLITEIGNCRICIGQDIAKPLPHEPRPVVVASTSSKIAICGQAPGTRVHQSGIPFQDPSGDRLRDWLGVSEEQFYDRNKFAIVPMGFCFPGLDAKGGDLPPRKECAVAWRQKVMDAMPQLHLLLIVGIHAQAWHFGKLRKKNLTETVKAWREYTQNGSMPIMFPLPHPSWRNNSWIKKNAWFENELLVELKELIQGNI